MLKRFTQFAVLFTLLSVIMVLQPVPPVQACTSVGDSCAASYDCCSNHCCNQYPNPVCGGWYCSEGCAGIYCTSDTQCCRSEQICFGAPGLGTCQ